MPLCLCLWPEQKPDSLENQLKFASKTKRIELLNRLARSYLEKDPQKSISFGQQALTEARQLNHREGEYDALVNIGVGLSFQGNQTLSEPYLENAIANGDRLFDIKRKLSNLTSLGQKLRASGNSKQALRFYLKALELSNKIGNESRIAHLSNYVGAAYWDLNVYDQALEHYMAAYQIFKKTGNQTYISNLQNNIGMVYQAVGDYEKAHDLYQQSLTGRKQLGLKEGVGGSLHNIGQVYLNQKKYRKALKCFEESLTVRKEINDIGGMARCLNDIGRISMELDVPEKAVDYFQRALKLGELAKSKRDIVDSLNNLGACYIKQKEFTKAFPFLKRCMTLSKIIDSKIDVQDCYNNFAKYYAGKGDYYKAFQYINRYIEIKEIILSQESMNKVNELKNRLAIEKQENENTALRRKIQIQALKNKMQIIIGVSALLILVVSLFLIYRNNKYYKNELSRKEERQKRLELESKIKLMQVRVNPHFLYNSLESIRELGQENNPEKIEDFVQNLSNLYRRIFSSNDALVIPIREEINMVRDYLETEKRMLNGDLDYIIKVDEELWTFPVMPLSIEILVENAVIHGISSKEEGLIEITVQKDDNNVIIEILDNGVGVDLSKIIPGFGLYSIQERLKLYYKGKGVLKMNSTPGEGTCVKMELPHA